MYRSCVPATLCFFLIAGVFCYLLPGKAFSVPLLKDGAKYRVNQRAKPAPPVRSIITLGSYRDISGVKNNVSFIADLSRRFSPRLISAKSIVVMDSVTGRTLFSRSPDTYL